MAKSVSLRIAVDIGGTFTDGIAHAGSGNRIWVAKELTTPADPGIAVSHVVDDLLAAVARDHDGVDVTEVVHGTTLVTNTIIERNGARTGLLVTEGTKDVLDIAREFRYDLYDLELALPTPLVERGHREEVKERLDAAGAVLISLDDKSLETAVTRLRRHRVESVAVCLLHAYANPVHERRIERYLKKHLPGVAVSLSCDVAAEIREYERMSTTSANAYVMPLMARYLNELSTRLKRAKIRAPLRVMTSSGGFTSSKTAARQPITLLESGPAGGVLSAVNTARQAGIQDLLALDMGGTTAKACVAVGGEADVAHSFEAARVKRFTKGSGLPMLIPSIDLIEIGAGGGSIAGVSRLGLLNVGPESAGAQPGPACYGQGGSKPTVTDADLLLGFLDPGAFLGGEMTLDVECASKALDGLAQKLGLETMDTAWGIHNLVNENMAGAARVHVAEKGLDPRRFSLVATGGAGPVHAIEVAHKLGINHILCPVAAGAGSCLGLLAAPGRIDRSFSKVQLLSQVDEAGLRRTLERLYRQATKELGQAGADSIRWTLGAEVRYAGQGNAVDISIPYRVVDETTIPKVGKAFEQRYRQLYGGLVPDARPEVVTWRLTGQSRTRARTFKLDVSKSQREVKPSGKRPMYHPAKRRFAGTPVYERYSLPPGTTLRAPLVLQERECTIVVARPAEVAILDNLTVSITLS